MVINLVETSLGQDKSPLTFQTPQHCLYTCYTTNADEKNKNLLETGLGVITFLTGFGAYETSTLIEENLLYMV